MKIKRLKNYAIPLIILLLLTTILYSSYRIWQILSYDSNITNDTYVSNNTNDQIIPTNKEEKEVIRPYKGKNINIEIPFYNIDGTDKEQQQALILYENIYMQNTGVMYTSDQEFNCISVLDGVVKDIKDDPIMGKIVEIENNKNITTIYQSLKEVNIKVGDNLKQKDVIGISGQNKITDSKYALHFEVYKKGEIIDPEQFYLLSMEDINE